MSVVHRMETNSNLTGNAAKPLPISQILADAIQAAKLNDFISKWKTVASR